MATINSIITLGDWLEKTLKTKTGIFVVGLFMGILPFLFTSVVLYKNGERKDTEIHQKYERIVVLEKEVSLLQQEVIQANEKCLLRLNEMVTLLQTLREYYDGMGTIAGGQVETEKELLDMYNDLAKKYNYLLSVVEDEK